MLSVKTPDRLKSRSTLFVNIVQAMIFQKDFLSLARACFLRLIAKLGVIHRR